MTHLCYFNCVVRILVDLWIIIIIYISLYVKILEKKKRVERRKGKAHGKIELTSHSRRTNLVLDSTSIEKCICLFKTYLRKENGRKYLTALIEF